MRNLLLSSSIVLVVAVSLISLNMATDAESLKAGQAIHTKLCLRCHGELGQGDGPARKLLKVKPADWTDQERMTQYSDEDLFKVVKFGGTSVGRSRLMPGFKTKMKDDQIRQIIIFIKSLKTE